MKILKRRVAVVTGAADGIALALRYAQNGMKWALADSEKAPLARALA